MNSFSDPYNFVLWFVVLTFWATVILLSRVHRRAVSPRLLLIPAFFILVGMTINLYFKHIGTYMIALIHVIMLPALLKVAKRRP